MIGDATFALVEPEDLGRAQIGYAVTPSGEELRSGEGAWKSEWVVIGSDEDLGDPLFVDMGSDELPVLTAEHGMGVWEPVQVASSLARLIGQR